MTGFAAKARAGLIVFLLAVIMTPTAGAAQIKIGVIDTNTVIGQSDAGRAANDSLARFIESTKADLTKRQKAIEDMRQSLDDASTPAEEREKKTLELDQLENELQAMISEAQKAIDNQAEEYRKLVLEDVGKVLALIAEENGYHVIIDSSSVFYYARLVDITWEVIRKYNDLFEKASQSAQGQ
jgi:outer membrane protein